MALVRPLVDLAPCPVLSVVFMLPEQRFDLFRSEVVALRKSPSGKIWVGEGKKRQEVCAVFGK